MATRRTGRGARQSSGSGRLLRSSRASSGSTSASSGLARSTPQASAWPPDALTDASSSGVPYVATITASAESIVFTDPPTRTFTGPEFALTTTIPLS